MSKYMPQDVLGHSVSISTSFRMAPGMMIVKDNPNVSHWTFEGEYDQMFGKFNEYPQRIAFTASSSPLLFVFKVNYYDYEYMCMEDNRWFKVTLTPPGEISSMSRRAFRVPIGSASMITVEPKITWTSEKLRHYDPNHRKCFYQHERQLRFFKIYTQHNCEEECLANFTKNECECVKFSMPSMKIFK